MLQQTFSEKIKQELCSYEYNKNSLLAILSSYFTNNRVVVLTNNSETWEIRTQLLSSIQLINNALEKCFNVKGSISYSEINKLNNRRIYLLTLDKKIKEINKTLQLDNIYPHQILNSDINKRSYLVGAFLSGGSISSIDKSIYHLEIRSTNINYLRTIQKLICSFNISISLLKRKNNYVLYIKKASELSDFLKIIGAYNSMYELEDKIIARDYYSNIQRINNLDVANLHKSSLAGFNQIKMIKKIKDTDEFKQESDKFKFFCTIRLKNPEKSLSEIVDIFNNDYKINITRTGINHYVIRIKEIYKKVSLNT